MANTNPKPTNAALSVLLTDIADSITNVAAHEAEQNIRLAAERLRNVGEPALIIELRKVAPETSDASTAVVLKGILGELAN